MNKIITPMSLAILLLFLPSCIDQVSHQERVEEKAERAHADISHRYKREISALGREKNKAQLKQQIKDEALAKYDHPAESFPLMAYKKDLTQSINRLADQQHMLIKYAYMSELRRDIGRTIDQLEVIGRQISTDSEYKDERIRFDEHRRQNENNMLVAGLAGAAVGAVVGAATAPRETIVVHEPVVEVAYVPYAPVWPGEVVEVEHVYEYY